MSILVEEARITKILEAAKTIAVVGLSDKPWRPSFGVSAYMQKQGYRIIPVNPHLSKALGEISYERLEDVPGPIDVVNIFRRSENVGPIVDAAIRLGARCVWMQEGVVDYEAAARAEAAGLDVVVNRCILKYHRRLAR